MVCVKISKYVLMVTNIIFWIFSCAMLVMSVILKVNLAKHHDELQEHSFENGVNVAIAVSVINFVIAILGCCGAIKESKACLSLYFALNIIIFTMCIASVAVNYSKIPKNNSSLKQTFKDIDSNTKAYEDFEKIFDCCGTVTVCGNFTGGVPVGCACEPNEEDCHQLKDVKGCNAGANVASDDYIYSKSCYEKIEVHVTKGLKILGGIGIGMICLDVLLMILSLVVCLNVKKDGEESV